MKLKIRLCLLVICCFTARATFAQRQLAMVKQSLLTLNVYALPSSKSEIIARPDKSVVFYCDSTAGEWYKFDVSHIEQDIVNGYVRKADVNLFAEQPVTKQKVVFNQVFDMYIKLAQSPKKMVAYPAYLGLPSRSKIAADNFTI